MSTETPKTERKKPKLVRDSFTIPKAEYGAIDLLKTRAIALGRSVKKSELLRAGLLALQGMSDAGFKQAIDAVPQLKTGRPANQAASEAPAVQPTPAARKAAVPAGKTRVSAKVTTKKPASQAVASRPASATGKSATAAPRRAKASS